MQTSQGKVGEGLAAAYLRAHGYAIRAQNWRMVGGEIDIIAERDGVIVMVEVKTRSSADTESAFASITPRKRTTMIRAAESYLAAHDLSDAAWRIDVIAVALRGKAQPLIDHVEDALGW